jgi:hypothetical protein
MVVLTDLFVTWRSKIRFFINFCKGNKKMTFLKTTALALVLSAGLFIGSSHAAFRDEGDASSRLTRSMVTDEIKDIVGQSLATKQKATKVMELLIAHKVTITPGQVNIVKQTINTASVSAILKGFGVEFDRLPEDGHVTPPTMDLDGPGDMAVTPAMVNVPHHDGVLPPPPPMPETDADDFVVLGLPDLPLPPPPPPADFLPAPTPVGLGIPTPPPPPPAGFFATPAPNPVVTTPARDKPMSLGDLFKGGMPKLKKVVKPIDAAVVEEEEDEETPFAKEMRLTLEARRKSTAKFVDPRPDATATDGKPVVPPKPGSSKKKPAKTALVPLTAEEQEIADHEEIRKKAVQAKTKLREKSVQARGAYQTAKIRMDKALELFTQARDEAERLKEVSDEAKKLFEESQKSSHA